MCFWLVIAQKAKHLGPICMHITYDAYPATYALSIISRNPILTSEDFFEAKQSFFVATEVSSEAEFWIEKFWQDICCKPTMFLSSRLLVLAASIVLLASAIGALRPVEKSLFVVFGRPGSGKTTVANEAFGIVSSELSSREGQKVACLALDLDVCVTQVMRDNFGKGIYPTLEERKVFASEACDYVEEQLAQVCNQGDEKDSICAIISFSFVNTDLRDIFRSRFPSAEWILMDTSEEECTKRINEREGHFYKGEISTEDTASETSDGSPGDVDEKDNSDWKFAPVDFPHVILDGLTSVEENAKKVAEKILQDTQ